MQSKKKLKQRIDYLEQQSQGIDEVTDLLNNTIELVRKKRDEWRIKYELLLHTPEYKADVEAATKRGQQLAVSKFRAWFLTTAQKLDSVVEETDEK